MLNVRRSELAQPSNARTAGCIAFVRYIVAWGCSIWNGSTQGARWKPCPGSNSKGYS
jgi:hypothetical protein